MPVLLLCNIEDHCGGTCQHTSGYCVALSGSAQTPCTASHSWCNDVDSLSGQLPGVTVAMGDKVLPAARRSPYQYFLALSAKRLAIDIELSYSS